MWTAIPETEMAMIDMSMIWLMSPVRYGGSVASVRPTPPPPHWFLPTPLAPEPVHWHHSMVKMHAAD
jgi:hypothetical protein